MMVRRALEDVIAVETNTATFRCTLRDPNVTVRWFIHTAHRTEKEITSEGNYNVIHNGVDHQLNIYDVRCRDEGLVYIKTSGNDNPIDAANLQVLGKGAFVICVRSF